jgi:hypothetical protein
MTLKEYIAKYGTDGTSLQIEELARLVNYTRPNLAERSERMAQDLREMLLTENGRSTFFDEGSVQ